MRTLSLVLLAACSVPDADTEKSVGDETESTESETTESGEDTESSDTESSDTESSDTEVVDTEVPMCGTTDKDEALLAFIDAIEVLEASLSEELVEDWQFELDDAERWDWDNRPAADYARLGLEFGKLDEEQLALAYAVLEAGLGAGGYDRVTGIILQDAIALANGDGKKGAEYYYLGVFGTPDVEGAWGLQLDGHHLAVNWTVVGCELVVTPTFQGIMPLEIEEGEREGEVVLGTLSDAAWELVAVLASDQLDVMQTDAELDVGNVVMGPGRDDPFPDYDGLLASELTTEQQVVFLDLVDAWLTQMPDPWRQDKLTEVATTLDSTWIEWVGPYDADGLYYYSIHSPTLWLEYDVTMTTNHVHTMMRDPLNDYGEDLLAEHYETSDHGGPAPRPRLERWPVDDPWLVLPLTR